MGIAVLLAARLEMWLYVSHRGEIFAASETTSKWALVGLATLWSRIEHEDLDGGDDAAFLGGGSPLTGLTPHDRCLIACI